MHSQEEFCTLLKNTFPSLISVDEIANKLTELSTDDRYEALYIILEGCSELEIKGQITDQFFWLILHYLTLKKNQLELFAIFSADILGVLYPLEHCLSNVYENKPLKFVQLCDAIAQYKLSKAWLHKKSINLLLELNEEYLTNVWGVSLLNKLGELCPKSEHGKIIRVLKLLANEADSSFEELISVFDQQKVSFYFDILNKLDSLGLKPETIKDWSILANLDSEWFETKKQTKKITAKLDKKIFSLYGYKYLLTKIPFKNFNTHLIFVLNFFLKIYLLDEKKESDWAQVGQYFKVDEQKLGPLCKHLETVIKSAEFKRLQQNAIQQHLRKIHTILQFNENFFENRNDINKLLTLACLHENIYCPEGFKLLDRIQKLSIEITENYILKLNKIINKRQLEYIGTLYFLSDEWLTEEGLAKLDLFSGRFLSPEGIKFINRFKMNAINDEIIKTLNTSNHNLFNYIVDTSTTNTSLEDLLSIRVRRANIISSFTEKLKTSQSQTNINANSVTLSLSKRDTITRSLLQDECMYTSLNFLSAKAEDTLLWIDPKRTNPITIAELNNVLCLITRGPSYVIVSRGHAIKHINLENVRHPYEDKIFSLADVIDFDESNINIETVNKHFHLISNASHEVDLSMSRNIQVLRCDELLKSPVLEKLPEIFFLSEHVTLLLNLDNRYLNDEFLLKFLMKYIGNQVNKQKILFLNKNVENLLILAQKINLIWADWFDKLPNIFFENDFIFTLNKIDFELLKSRELDYFENLLEHGASQETIVKLNSLLKIKFFPIINAQVFNTLPSHIFADKQQLIAALHKLACNDLNFAQEIFADNSTLFFSLAQLASILSSHVNQDDFLALIYAVRMHINEKFCGNLTVSHKALCQKLYSVAHYQKDYWQESVFSSSVFLLLQKLNRLLLIKELVLVESQNLIYLQNYHDSMFQYFKSQLHAYERNRLRRDKNGELTTRWTRTAKKRLVAFNELTKLVDAERPIPDILHLIGLQADNIGLYESRHFFKGLQTYCQELYDRLRTLKFHFSQTLLECREDPSGKLLALCLMNEVFYSLLESNQLIDLINIKPSIFFYVMEIYRPVDLQQLIALSNNTSEFKSIKSHYDLYQLQKKGKINGIDLSKDKRAVTNSVFKPWFIEEKSTTLPKELKKIQSLPEYQLQDMDITAGILFLLQELQIKNLEKDFFIFPLGPIDQQGAKMASTLNAIQEVTETNINRLCFGIMNINRNHYFFLVGYLSDSNVYQFLIIDPAFATPEKKNTLTKIQNLLKEHFIQCNITTIEVVQQLNDSDCGIACLQTIYDVIHNNAITLVNNKIVIDIKKLTLNAENYQGKDKAFEELTIEVRKRWEENLSKLDTIFIVYPDGQKSEAWSYSFTSNKKLQFLKMQAQNHLDEILKKFIILHNYDIQQHHSGFSIPVMSESYYKEMIQKFISSNTTCQAYFICLKEIKNIRDNFPSEVIDFNENTIEEKIIRQIQLMLRDTMSEEFNKQFLSFIKTNNYELEYLLKEENCIEPYLQFVENKGHSQWIEFFTGNGTWDHFHQVRLFLEKAYKTEKSSLKTKMLSFFGVKPHEPNTSRNSYKSADSVLMPLEEEDADEEKENIQLRIDMLKLELTKIVDEIITNLDKYPTIPQRKFFGKWHTSQEEVLFLKLHCDQFLRKIEQVKHLHEAENMRVIIAGKVYKYFSNSTSWRGKLDWDQYSLGNLLKNPLAKLVGIPEDLIKKYDTPQEFEIRKRVIPDLDSEFEQLPVMYHIRIVKTGYEQIADLIAERLYRVKRPNFNSHEHSRF